MLVEALTGNSQLSLPSPLQLSITISSLLWGGALVENVEMPLLREVVGTQGLG